jgi:hypothetical protein
MREGASAMGRGTGGRDVGRRAAALRMAGGFEPMRGGAVLPGTLVLPNFEDDAGFSAELPDTRPAALRESGGSTTVAPTGGLSSVRTVASWGVIRVARAWSSSISPASTWRTRRRASRISPACW